MNNFLIVGQFVLNISFSCASTSASLSAMYAVSLRSIRYGDGYVVRTYFKAFKQSFRQSTISFLVLAACGFLLFFDYRFWNVRKASSLSHMMQVISIVIAILIGVVAMWLFPLIAKMNDSLLTQVKNAARMAFGYFIPYTVCAAGLAVFAVWLATLNPGLTIIMALFGFSTVSWLQSLFFYKVFSKHISEDPVGADDPLYGENYKA